MGQASIYLTLGVPPQVKVGVMKRYEGKKIVNETKSHFADTKMMAYI